MALVLVAKTLLWLSCSNKGLIISTDSKITVSAECKQVLMFTTNEPLTNTDLRFNFAFDTDRAVYEFNGTLSYKISATENLAKGTRFDSGLEISTNLDILWSHFSPVKKMQRTFY